MIALDDDESSELVESDEDLAENDDHGMESDSHISNMMEEGDNVTDTPNNSKFFRDHLGHLVNVQEARYSLLDGERDQKPCPAQCTVLVSNKEATAVLDTGAGGSVVSSEYLSQFDKNWESKVSCLKSGTWKDYGSEIVPVGVYTADIVLGHSRGNIRAQMRFVVMRDDWVSMCFMIGNDNINVFDIRVHIHGKYFTLGNNLKMKFELNCFKQKKGCDNSKH